MPFVALAGIGVLGEAIAALCILAAVLLCVYLIEKFGGYLPFIGAWVASNAAAFYTWSVNQLSYVYNGALWALTNLVNTTVTVFTYPLAQIRLFALVTANALWWVKFVAIPNAINAAINWAAAGIHAAEVYALGLYGQAITFAQAVLQAAYNYANAVLQAAYNYANAVATAAYTYALNLYYGALSYIDQRYQAAIGLAYGIYNLLASNVEQLRQAMYAALGIAVQGIETEIATLEMRLTALIEQYAAAAEKDAIHLVDVIAAGGLTAVWPDLVTDVDGILAEIPQDLIDIRDKLASIPRAIPTGLLDALVALGAIAIPLVRYLKECGVPMCGNLHGLSDLLGALSTVEADAALFGLITSAIHDPHAAVRDIESTIMPIARDAESLFKSLIGV